MSAEEVDTPLHTVLAVEDSPIYRRILTRHLEQALACRVLQADGVESAVSTLLRERPDLVVTDLTMPDLDGADLIHIMHEHEEWRTIPVVIHSSENVVTRVRSMKEYGVRGYILKPFNPEIAIPRLRRAFAASFGVLRPAVDRAAPVDTGRIPILIATTHPEIEPLVARALGSTFEVSTAPSGPEVFVATLRLRPWMVFLAPDMTQWNVTKTQNALTALKTLEPVRVFPVPDVRRAEAAAVDAIRDEVGAGPFTVKVETADVSVVIHPRFAMTCVEALRSTVRQHLAPGTSRLTFEVPADGLPGPVMAAIADLARALRK